MTPRMPMLVSNAERWPDDAITDAVFWGLEDIEQGSSQGLQGVSASMDGITGPLWRACAEAGAQDDHQDRFPTKNDYDRTVARRVAQAILTVQWMTDDPKEGEDYLGR